MGTQRLAAIIDVSLTVMGLPGAIPEFLERGLGCVKEGDVLLIVTGYLKKRAGKGGFK